MAEALELNRVGGDYNPLSLFSGSVPEISEPASCRVWRGSLSKRLWGIWYHWAGTELAIVTDPDVASTDAAMERMTESSDARLRPLDFSASFFPIHDAGRFLKSPGRGPYALAVSEAGSVWSWRHAEVLMRIMKDRYRDFRSKTEE